MAFFITLPGSRFMPPIAPRPRKDKSLPHGDLYIDTEGQAHFQCTTKGEDFYQTRDALLKYIGLLQRQIDNERQCPFFKP